MKYLSVENQILRSLRQSFNMKTRHKWDEAKTSELLNINGVEMVGKGILKISADSVEPRNVWIKEMTIPDLKAVIKYMTGEEPVYLNGGGKPKTSKVKEKLPEEKPQTALELKNGLIIPKSLFDENGKVSYPGDDDVTSVRVKRVRKITSLVEEAFDFPFTKRMVRQLSKMRNGNEKERKTVDMILDVVCDREKSVSSTVLEEHIHTSEPPIFMWG